MTSAELERHELSDDEQASYQDTAVFRMWRDKGMRVRAYEVTWRGKWSLRFEVVRHEEVAT